MPKGDVNTQEIDEGTLLGIISLVVAILSTLVCIGQVLQQYYAAGSPIRLCDSIVYGGPNGLPGKGRRVWLWNQFRFRIIYDMPRISLVPLSPSLGVFAPFLIKPSPSFDWPPPENKLMSELASFDDKNVVGEAGWVAYSRVLLQACAGSVIVNRVAGDADRAPSDMTNIPMPVSLRDIAIFSSFIGMECTGASFVSGELSMSGPTGTITSSQHPTLGSCVHYAPPQDGFRLSLIGLKIDPAWVLRACGRLRIAGVILLVGTDSKETSRLLAQPEISRDSQDSETSYDEKLLHPGTENMNLRIVSIPLLTWYWMSQISIIPGFWATPFKNHPNIEVCWGGQEVFLKSFSELFYRPTVAETYPLGYTKSSNVPDVLCGTNTITYPPYGIRHGLVGQTMDRNVIQMFASLQEYVESTAFDCHIPKLLIRKESLTPTAHTRLDDHYLCGVELMAIDVWLSIVSKTVPIMAGRRQLLPKVPSIVEEILTTCAKSLEEIRGRADVEKCSEALIENLRAMGLTEAEKMYILVALLRTVKVGMCIRLGNDTTPLLEVVEKDVQAHML